MMSEKEKEKDSLNPTARKETLSAPNLRVKALVLWLCKSEMICMCCG